jgi:uncharacterized protein YcsI (UPF0317 family)
MFEDITKSTILTSSPLEIRQLIRKGDWSEQTSGILPGYVQGNLVILPQEYAYEFLQYCYQNPKPCPLIGMSEPGNPSLEFLGEDIDIRYDLPKYRVFKDGLMKQVNDIASFWRNDLVSFVIGCSYSFEGALIEADLDVRHITMGVNVPMYQTNIPTRKSGKFSGNLVVSMRPFKPRDAIQAIEISSAFSKVHGAPVHFGIPQQIGITDMSKPDFGDPVNIYDDEVPVFWACGVTPQIAIRNAEIPFCITHEPGCMLVTDIKNSKMSLS